MKLLVSEMAAWGGYVSREYFYVMRELIERHGWRHVDSNRLWRDPRSFKAALLAEAGGMPETILFWESYHLLRERALELLRLDCHKCIFADDLHWWNEAMRMNKRLAYTVCDTVLASYAYTFEKFFPDIARAKELVWVPHAASPDFMLPFNKRPLEAVLLSGAVNHYYPLRLRVKAMHERDPERVAYRPHPGYHCGYDYESDASVGRGYARTLNQYRVCFTDSLKYGYVVAKYFEIPATGALLLADAAVGGQLARLGFVAGKHYVPVTGRDLEERVAYVLDEANRAALDEVRRAGQALVRERHQTADRARLIDEVCAPPQL